MYDDHESEDDEDDAVSLRSEEEEVVEEDPVSEEEAEEEEALKEEVEGLEDVLLEEDEAVDGDDGASHCTESSGHTSTPGKQSPGVSLRSRQGGVGGPDVRAGVGVADVWGPGASRCVAPRGQGR